MIAPRAREVLLLAAHGSSSSESARTRIMQLAAQVAPLVPHDAVRVAFARGAPTLEDAMAEIVATAATSVRVTVVPVMTSAGYFASEVLPRRLRTAAGDAPVEWAFTKPLGAMRSIGRLLHQRARRCLAGTAWSMADTTVLLVGHGTRRHAASRATAWQHAETLRARGWHTVQVAFIDDEPGIAETLAQLAATPVIVLPFLMGGADHALVDVPEALGFGRTRDDARRGATIAERSVILDAPLGTDPHLPWLVSQLAHRSWLRARSRMAAQHGSRARARRGAVALVGAGPGAADLLTVRACRLLRWADVVVHDRLVSDAILRLVRPGARLVDVGKWPETAQSVQSEINAILIAHAQRGQRVVRLKGGDPMVFGRGSEEVEACRAAGVPVAVVPGISSALAAPALAGIPVTARHISRSLAVVTAATATDADGRIDQLAAVAQADTVVVLMAHARLATVCDRLQAAGRAADTPAACIERASLPGERVVRGTLTDIAVRVRAAALQAPMVLVVGPTCALPAPDWNGQLSVTLSGLFSGEPCSTTGS